MRAPRPVGRPLTDDDRFKMRRAATHTFTPSLVAEPRPLVDLIEKALSESEHPKCPQDGTLLQVASGKHLTFTFYQWRCRNCTYAREIHPTRFRAFLRERGITP